MRPERKRSTRGRHHALMCVVYAVCISVVGGCAKNNTVTIWGEKLTGYTGAEGKGAVFEEVSRAIIRDRDGNSMLLWEGRCVIKPLLRGWVLKQGIVIAFKEWSGDSSGRGRVAIVHSSGVLTSDRVPSIMCELSLAPCIQGPEADTNVYSGQVEGRSLPWLARAESGGGYRVSIALARERETVMTGVVRVVMGVAEVAYSDPNDILRKYGLILTPKGKIIPDMAGKEEPSLLEDSP